MELVKKVKGRTLRAFEKFQDDEILTRSAALAYYSTLSAAPILLLAVTLLGLVDLNIHQQLLGEIQNLIGEKASKAIDTVILGAKERPDLASLSGWVSGILLLVSASVIFAELQNTLNIIFGVQIEDDLSEGTRSKVTKVVKRRLFSFLLVLITILLSISSVLVSAVLAGMVEDADSWIWDTLQIVINVVTFSLLFSFLFKFLPDREMEMRDCFIGGVITACLFIVGKQLIGIYLGKAAIGSAYGAAGSLVVLLVWLYYSSLIVFSGAEISAALYRKKM